MRHTAVGARCGPHGGHGAPHRQRETQMHTRPSKKAMRRTALVAGALYLITFVTSIPTLKLYEPLRDHPDFVLGVGNATGVMWGALLEVVLAIACVGTAVVLFPVVK